MHARGVDGDIELDGEHVVIRYNPGKRRGGYLHGRAREKRIPVDEILEVQLTPASLWWRGHIRFKLRGGQGPSTARRTRKATVAAAALDPNSVLFKRRRQGEFQVLRARILTMQALPDEEDGGDEWPFIRWSPVRTDVDARSSPTPASGDEAVRED